MIENPGCRRPAFPAAVLLIACVTIMRPAQNPAWAVATFEATGLYYNHPAAPEGCHVRHRAAGAVEWREG